MMRKPAGVLLTALVLSGLIVLAAVVGGGTAASSRPTVKTAFNKTLKKTIVVDGKGWTVYMFTADTSGTSTCTVQLIPDCPKVWPPVRSQGAPVGGKGIIASKLGTTKRADGRTQVTYNRHPLYYFRGPGADKKPGDVRGQNFAQLWYVLSPQGRPIRK